MEKKVGQRGCDKWQTRVVSQMACTQLQQFSADAAMGSRWVEGRHGQAQTRTEALAAPLHRRWAVPRSHVHARHEPLAQLAVLKTVA